MQQPCRTKPNNCAILAHRLARRRFHPILREVRPHLGVDYRAPIGAPVIAVADGVVVEAGMNGGAGRMVHLRHVNGFESEYLHLSTITVRPGTHVRQGDLIGRVGMTGLATGPHLHFEILVAGVQRDPRVALQMKGGQPIATSERGLFNRTLSKTMATFGPADKTGPAEVAGAAAAAARAITGKPYERIALALPENASGLSWEALTLAAGVGLAQGCQGPGISGHSRMQLPQTARRPIFQPLPNIIHRTAA